LIFIVAYVKICFDNLKCKISKTKELNFIITFTNYVTDTLRKQIIFMRKVLIKKLKAEANKLDTIQDWRRLFYLESLKYSSNLN
jgi:hypothetical protein